MSPIRWALLACLAAPFAAQPTTEDWRIESHTWREEVPAGLPILLDNPYGELRVRAFDWQGCELQGVSQRHRNDPRPIELAPRREADRLVLAVRMPADARDAGAPRE